MLIVLQSAFFGLAPTLRRLQNCLQASRGVHLDASDCARANGPQRAVLLTRKRIDAIIAAGDDP